MEVYNFYGPTETNVCTAYRVPGLDASRLPLAISISLFLIADIDSPRAGLIRVAPANLLHLSETLHLR